MSNRDLAEHIKALNAKSNSDFEVVSKLEHWADYDIYTPEEFDRYMLEQDYVGLHKDLYGIRPSASLKYMTDDMLKQAIDTMYDSLEAEIEDLRDYDLDELRDFVAHYEDAVEMYEDDLYDEIAEDFDDVTVTKVLH